MHPGATNPTAPHVQLTSGLHSDGFINALAAISYANICRIFAMSLQMKYWASTRMTPTWVVGSDHAGVAISHAVAEVFGCRHDFTRKDPATKGQVWERFVIGPSEVVLQVEDLMTTRGTTLAVRAGIRAAHPVYPIRFAPLVLTVVHRSAETEIEGDPIFWLVHYDIHTYEPPSCPLCSAGSPVFRPKQADHWAELQATGKTEFDFAA